MNLFKSYGIFAASTLVPMADATPAEQNHALKLFIAVAVVVGIIIFLTRKSD